ncbi:MAG TPA: hypothetical protein VJ346_08290 [Bacteroidales bacterium]|nr:hypothetical protein [Bacteroidales bacterium]
MKISGGWINLGLFIICTLYAPVMGQIKCSPVAIIKSKSLCIDLISMYEFSPEIHQQFLAGLALTGQKDTRQQDKYRNEGSLRLTDCFHE